MIEVKNLTKIYKSRKGGKCVALDHISFTLPDRGFLFVVGKSGSGKTTLLSLLGGLDTITDGDILVDGRSLRALGAKSDVAYRNCEVGFIFQDFHLIDDLTVAENILLALELQGKRDEERVRAALKATGLEGYGARYPKELSGGQKQRVAIARAIVKDPKIVLADEPTGNLDSKTTAQILRFLKVLSRDKLVVIVSHDLADAQQFADEILELSDGRILRHEIRNTAFDPRLRIEGDTLVIPCRQEFPDADVSTVNHAMARWYVRGVRQDKNQFLPYTERRKRGSMSAARPLENRHLRFGSRLKTATKLSRKGWLRSALYALILAALMVVLGLSQLIMDFNGGEVLASEMAKRDLSCGSFIKDTSDRYDSVDATRLVDVDEDDLQTFYDAGYTGKAYPIVNYALFNLGSNVCVNQQRLTPQMDPYGVKETAGVLVTERSYVEKLFGSLEFVALSDEPKDYGVYITDFFADACMANHPGQTGGYKSFLGESNQYTGYRYGYINGVIKTGYKEKNKELLGKLADTGLSKDELKKISQTDEYLAFYDNLSQFLNIAYAFDPDFVSLAVASKIRQFVSTGISVFEKDGKEYEYKASWFSCEEFHNTVSLHDNEILINCDVYNKIFGTNYTQQTIHEFVPHEVKLTYYLFCDQNKSQKRYETTLKVVGLNDNNACINVADNVYRDLQHIEMFTFGYYFDNAEQTALVTNVAGANGFIPNSSIGSSITVMAKAVGVFSDFFVLIFAMLCVALFVLMVQFEVKSIKDKMKEIGILKALGARNCDLFFLFGAQIAAAGVLMLLFYILSSFVFIGLANKLLVYSLTELSKGLLVLDLTFLTVKWRYILQNCLLAVAILAASFVIPMLRLRRIKPTNVIKAKE